ncbi:hypothetical protein PENARI_c054G11290 [Penicillium arizonense]|uniref:Reverse transcriptase Ty1/copia-type domain-containing protein n=1 Tax=Penicillium arizonense TaxID=1835702 RepID=A0A1F5L2G1_PENAI|nr:hypothetical protein PENARI_c054G11290 [Penicillium arizonense]OGE47227.1 hypothetical protein PENARI_c054G11290 [Penicillium arizonense]
MEASSHIEYFAGSQSFELNTSDSSIGVFESPLPTGFSSVGPLEEGDPSDEECGQSNTHVTNCNYRRSGGTYESWAIRPFEAKGLTEPNLRKNYQIYTGRRKPKVSNKSGLLRGIIDSDLHDNENHSRRGAAKDSHKGFEFGLSAYSEDRLPAPRLKRVDTTGGKYHEAKKVVPLREEIKPVTSRWVTTDKYGPDVEVTRRKACLVARGFQQEEGIDYEETFASVVKSTSTRILLALAAICHWHIHQGDVKTAFLNSDLDKPVYMKAPRDVQLPRGCCLLLLKAVYGLKQSPRAWYQKLRDTLVSWDWRMDAHKAAGEIHVHKKQYIDQVVKKYGFKDAAPVKTPLNKNVKLAKQGDYIVDAKFRKEYLSKVGSLNFSSNQTRPDIPLATGYVARYTSNPNRVHMDAVDRFFAYLNSDSRKGIVYLDKHGLQLTGFVDSDFAGCEDSRKSTTGWVFTLTGGPICWSSQRQKIVATSTMDAEYIACTEAAKEAVWIRNFISDLRIPVPLYMGSSSALKLTRSLEFHSKSKDIDVKHHFIREKVEEGLINTQRVNTKDNLADVFPAGTKPHCSATGETKKYVSARLRAEAVLAS